MDGTENTLTLLEKVKKNLILEHDEDDILLTGYIFSAVHYAESFQKKPRGAYAILADIPPTTEQAIIMLSSHFYESRDGSTGGFFSDSARAGERVWETINNLLRLEKDWQV